MKENGSKVGSFLNNMKHYLWYYLGLIIAIVLTIHLVRLVNTPEPVEQIPTTPTPVAKVKQLRKPLTLPTLNDESKYGLQLTKSMTLDKDLVIAEGPFDALLEIAADDVILDCNGFEVKGDAALAVAIRGKNKSTIKNCRFTDTDHGIMGTDLSNTKISDSTLNVRGNGLHFFDVDNLKIEKVEVAPVGHIASGSGIKVTESQKVHISKCYAHSFKQGLVLEGVYDFLVDGNRIQSVLATGLGLLQSPNRKLCSKGKIKNNHIIQAMMGLEIGPGSNDLQVIKNLVYGCFTPLRMDDQFNTPTFAPIEKIQFTGNFLKHNHDPAHIQLSEKSIVDLSNMRDPNRTKGIPRIPIPKLTENSNIALRLYKDTVLEKDLEFKDGPYDALVGILRDHITLDCNGHTISGKSKVGLYLTEATNLQIKNCDIQGTEHGVFGVKVKDVTVSGGTIHVEKNGMQFRNAESVAVSNIVFRPTGALSDGYGVELVESVNSKVSGCDVRHFSQGILTYGCKDFLISGNLLKSLVETGIGTFQTHEMVGSSQGHIEKNTILQTMMGFEIHTGSNNLLLKQNQVGYCFLPVRMDDESNTPHYNPVTKIQFVDNEFFENLNPPYINLVNKSDFKIAGFSGE